MIGGLTRVSADVSPFMIFVAARTHGRVRIVNGVGLKRCGFSEGQIEAIKKAWLRLYARRARIGGRAIRQIAEEILTEPWADDNVTYLCEFIIRSAAHGRQGRYLESLRPDNPNAPRPSGDGQAT